MDGSDAPVKSKGEIEIAAAPEIVWDVLTRFEQWPQWNPDVKSMSFDGPMASGSEFRWRSGPGTIVSTLERVEPPRAVSWRGRTMSIKAMHEWRQRYGRPPSSTDWSRTHASRRGGEPLERFLAREWPAPSTVIDIYGSWPAARADAFPDG